MGFATAAMVGLGFLQAGTSLMGGITRSREIEAQAEYNAKVYEQQAKMIDEQKKLEAYQYDRRIRRARGTNVARVAKAGLMLSGSPLAVMIDTETQMLLDKAIGQYNLEVEKRYTLSAAEESRRRGDVASRTAFWGGYTNAFTSMLTTGYRVSTFDTQYQRAGKI